MDQFVLRFATTQALFIAPPFKPVPNEPLDVWGIILFPQKSGVETSNNKPAPPTPLAIFTLSDSVGITEFQNDCVLIQQAALVIV